MPDRHRTSRLLAAGLQREYPNLDVRGVMSAFQLDPDKLRAEGVELVVSTVELDIKFRYLRVNPMLTMQDKMLLGTAIDALLLQKRIPRPRRLRPYRRSHVKMWILLAHWARKSMPCSTMCASAMRPLCAPAKN